MKLALASILLALGALVPTAAHADPLIPVDVIGQVQIIPGVACNGCTVTVVGAPVSVRTDADGWFEILTLPAGKWTLTVSSPDGSKRVTMPLYKPRLGEAPPGDRHEVLYLPTIVVAKPGAITGRVHVSTTDDLDDVVVAIPSLGLYVQPNIAGVYLLTGVPPGTHKVFVHNGIQRLRMLEVTTLSGALSTGKDFPAQAVATPTAP